MTGDPIFGSPVFMRTCSASSELQPLFYLALCKLFGDNSRFATRIRLAALFVFAKSSFRAFFLLNRESAKTLSQLVLSKSLFRRIYGANREFSLTAVKSLYSISRNSIFSKAYRDANSAVTEHRSVPREKILDFTQNFFQFEDFARSVPHCPTGFSRFCRENPGNKDLSPLPPTKLPKSL